MTIVKRAATLDLVKPMITNLFFVIVLFMVFLSIILNQSLIQSVSKFKNQDCRTLMSGLRNSQYLEL